MPARAAGCQARLCLNRRRKILRLFAKATAGALPLVGVGGIASGAQAYEKIRAGASLVQLYSALTYRGPDLVKQIKQDLAANLARDGFETISQAVGTALTD